jgi:hypothetical protein
MAAPVLPDFEGLSASLSSDFIHLLEATRQNPIEGLLACGESFQAVRAGYRRQRREHLAIVYAAAMHLRVNFAAWRAFVEHPVWGGSNHKPLIGEQAKALHWASMVTFKKSLGYDRAWKYARGLGVLMDEGVAPEEVVSRLEQPGGIDGLVRKAAQETPRRLSSKKADPNEGAPDDEDDATSADVDDGGRGDEEEDDPAVSPSEGAKAKAKRAAPRDLRVVLKPSLLKKVLKLPMGEEAQLTIKNVGKKGAWHQIKATNVELPELD